MRADRDGALTWMQNVPDHGLDSLFEIGRAIEIAEPEAVAFLLEESAEFDSVLDQLKDFFIIVFVHPVVCRPGMLADSHQFLSRFDSPVPDGARLRTPGRPAHRRIPSAAARRGPKETALW